VPPVFEAVPARADADVQSAKADFVPFQRRVFNPSVLWRVPYTFP
jgi:hypothetical protein